MTRPYVSVFVIYRNPRDFECDHGDLFVCRQQAAMPDGSIWKNPQAFVSPDLDMIRGVLQRMGMVRMERHPDDDPVIVETWI